MYNGKWVWQDGSEWRYGKVKLEDDYPHKLPVVADRKTKFWIGISPNSRFPALCKYHGA